MSDAMMEAMNLDYDDLKVEALESRLTFGFWDWFIPVISFVIGSGAIAADCIWAGCTFVPFFWGFFF